MPASKLPIVVLISGSGSNLQAIIDAIADQRITASINAVISNRPDAYGLQRAEAADINTIVIDHTSYTSRDDFDRALLDQVVSLQPDLVVLAGFMRILSDEFIEAHKGKILNIHPALLPAFKGLNTHRRALEAKVPVHGASVHFVNNELDSGPVVIQAEVKVNNDDEETLAQRVLEQEHIIYPMAIQWYIEGRLKLINNGVYLDNQPMSQPARWINNELNLLADA